MRLRSSNIVKERKIVMEKIASFTINHIKLQPGIYVSRKDHIGARNRHYHFDIRYDLSE